LLLSVFAGAIVDPVAPLVTDEAAQSAGAHGTV
jgi:hypothetical protein